MKIAEEDRMILYRAKVQRMREHHACLMKNSEARQRALIDKVLPELIKEGFCKKARDMSNVPDKRAKTI